MFEIYDTNGVYWGISKGESFDDACCNFFGTEECTIYQVREGEFNPKELTLFGVKLIPKIK